MIDSKLCPFCGGKFNWRSCRCDSNSSCPIHNIFIPFNKWNTRAESQELTTLRQQNAQLVEAARFVLDTFKSDLDAGYKTRDKEFDVDDFNNALAKCKGK